MNRIQKVSTYLLFIFNSLLVLLLPWLAARWFFAETDTTHPVLTQIFSYSLSHATIIETPTGLVHLDAIAWTPLLHMVGFASRIVDVLPLFLSFFVLKAIFRNYQQGEVFSKSNANHYQALGWLFFLDALIAKPLANLLIVLAATYANPVGHRYLVLSFGMLNIESLFCGALVIVISWVMREASILQDDQKFTI